MDSNFTRADSPLTQKVFKRFRQVVLGTNDNAYETKETQVLNKNLVILPYVCVFTFFTNLFWVLKDLLADGQFQLFDVQSLIAIGVNNVLSILMFILSLRKNVAKEITKRIALIVYYMSFMWMQAALIILRNKEYIDVVANDSLLQVGISLSSLYLLLPCFMPLPYKRDTIIIFVTSLISIIIPAFTGLGPAYPLISYLIFFLYIVAGVILYRHKLLKLEEKNIEVSQLNEFLGREAYLDDLTGSLNRRAFRLYWDYLSKKENIKNFGVILYDVDYFKSYNEFYSHIDADNVLKEIAYNANELVEEKENFIFRLNSEQFMVIYPNCVDDDVMNMARSIKTKIYDLNLKREDIEEFDRVTVSIGCMIVDKIDMDFKENIKTIDQQLYIAKCEGKNCIAFNNHVER